MRISIFFLLLTSFLIFGCSDSYEEALDSRPPTNQEIQEAVDKGKEIADEHNVTLSEDTQKKISELEAEINKSNASDTASTEVIENAINAISSTKEDIKDSNISEEEKSVALDKLNQLEREKLRDGLDALTQNIQNTDKVEEEKSKTSDCLSAPNTGALPPLLPPDDCYTGVGQ